MPRRLAPRVTLCHAPVRGAVGRGAAARVFGICKALAEHYRDDPRHALYEEHLARERAGSTADAASVAAARKGGSQSPS